MINNKPTVQTALPVQHLSSARHLAHSCSPLGFSNAHIDAIDRIRYMVVFTCETPPRNGVSKDEMSPAVIESHGF